MSVISGLSAGCSLFQSLGAYMPDMSGVVAKVQSVARTAKESARNVSERIIPERVKYNFQGVAASIRHSAHNMTELAQTVKRLPKDGRTKLYQDFALQKNFAAARVLLMMGADASGTSHIIRALSDENMEALQFFLKNGACVNPDLEPGDQGIPLVYLETCLSYSTLISMRKFGRRALRELLRHGAVYGKDFSAEKPYPRDSAIARTIDNAYQYETDLQRAVAFDRDLALQMCEDAEEITDINAFRFALYHRDHALIQAMLEKIQNPPHRLELLAREVLAEEKTGDRIEECHLVRLLISSSKKMPEEMIREMLSTLGELYKPKDNVRVIDRLYSLAYLKKDKTLLRVLNERLSEYRSPARVYFKVASNVLGFDGHYIVQDTRVKCEGMTGMASVLLHQKYMRSYFQDIDSPCELPKALRKQMVRAVECMGDESRSLDQIVSSIQAGQLEIIHSGWRKHSVVFVFYKGLLIRCNRGNRSASSEAGLETFSYDPKNLDKEMIAKLMQGQTVTKYLDKKSYYFLQGIERDLGAKKTGMILMKDQKVGNCGWASPKASFLACLVALDPGKDWAYYRKHYKAFTGFSRVKTYKQASSSPGQNGAFVRHMERKLAKKGLPIE